MGEEKSNLRETRFWRIIKWLILIVGISLFLIGISTIFIFPFAVEIQIRKITNLKKGGELYEKWLNPPYKSATEIYAYSVKNPDEIMNGSKPEISTIGPYVYDEKMSKKIFAYGNGTIKYANYDIFSFNANQSCEKCTLQHKVWIPNIVF
uniref:Scavenger receptor class B member 2 n=1 Tax=Ascaris lumbricoides TaxID=6252 RepID=A0A0M3IUL3_ASCLU